MTLKIAHNRTGKVRYSVIQVGPTCKIVGHYATKAGAENARQNWIAERQSSGLGPIVQLHEMQPGEFLS